MDADTSPPAGPPAGTRPDPIEVDRAQVLVLVAAGARLVETLGPGWYADAHLPGAVNVPHDRVDELAPLLLPGRAAPVVVYGSDPACHNCASVAHRLRALGYGDVRSYPGGKQDWVLAGLPLERGPVPPAAATGGGTA
ncbi:rhodanese-like domain-containing protein [Kineococcus glutinatus]|uniref:Rhodanese domain-containing protein n=1 Tax=Kineococcus glutinatus TaxID=1070872 RepID=A0ABP9HIR0_9ACTN